MDLRLDDILELKKKMDWRKQEWWASLGLFSSLKSEAIWGLSVGRIWGRKYLFTCMLMLTNASLSTTRVLSRTSWESFESWRLNKRDVDDAQKIHIPKQKPRTRPSLIKQANKDYNGPNTQHTGCHISDKNHQHLLMSPYCQELPFLSLFIRFTLPMDTLKAQWDEHKLLQEIPLLEMLLVYNCCNQQREYN